MKWEQPGTKRWGRLHRENPPHKFGMEMNSPSAKPFVKVLSQETSGLISPYFPLTFFPSNTKFGKREPQTALVFF